MVRARRSGGGARRAACLVALGLVVASCGRREAAPAEIRIGLLADRPSAIAESVVDSAMMAVEAIDAAGGIDVGGRRHTVKLSVEETGNTPEGATRASLKLINHHKVAAIVGSSFSRNAIPAGEVAERAGVPMISPGSSHPQVTAGRRYAFRVSFIDSYQGRVMALFARQELGLATAAALYDVADAYSRDIAAVFRRVFEEAGGRVVAFEEFTTGDRDFVPQLERIRAAAPAALFLPNFRTEIVLQGRQARRLGVDAVFLGSDGWTGEGLRQNPDLEGAFFSLNWHPDLGTTETRDFVARFRRAFGREPSQAAALTHDAFGLLFDAIATVAEADPESIREALARTEGFRGISGTITYRGRGGDPRRNAVIVHLEDGDFRLFKSVDPDPAP